MLPIANLATIGWQSATMELILASISRIGMSGEIDSVVIFHGTGFLIPMKI
jgi:hypothetical protein